MIRLPFISPLVLLLVAVSSAASPPRKPIDVSKLGPQVGQRVPAFSLKDQTGTVRTLQSLMGPKGAMLVFYRSADWWPYCKTQLVELQSRREELRANGLGVAAISYDSEEILARFSSRYGIAFPLLSDAGSQVIKAFGILNTIVEEALGPSGDDPMVAADLRKYVSAAGPARAAVIGIPFPGTFVVDRRGRVTSRFFEDSYRERNTVSSLLLRLGAQGAPLAGTQVSTDHLTVKTYASDPAVVPGNRVSLVLNIEPRPGMHLYAPGAAGYRVTTFAMEPQPFVRLLPVRYPASEIYFFKPLNERVPVYQKPFTLLQDVIVEATQEAAAAFKGRQDVSLKGALNYQACDDKICFNPVAVPLSWTLTLKPHITERISPP